MKLFSSEFSKINDKLHAKSVIMQKKGSSYTLLNHYSTDAENIQHISKNMPLNVGVDYYMVDETVLLPPINDGGTFKVLALNKLKESLEPGVSYLTAYKHYYHIPPDQNGNLTYKVFLAPESLFYTESGLTEDQMKNINFFTISDFALCALVQKYYPGLIVFHAYSDGKKMFVTVCHDDVIVYTRNNVINTNSTTDKFSNYYEYLNLTFMYATKNLRLKIDQVVLSGDLSQMTDLAHTFFEFSKVPQSTLIPGNVVRNCSYELFQEFMIPISLCFLNDAYDMTPKPVVVEQAKSTLKFMAGIASICIVAFLLFLNMISSFNLFNAYEELNIRALELTRNIRAYSELAAGSDNKKYELFYHNMLKKKDKNVTRLFPTFANLLALGNFSDVAFESEDDRGTSISVGGKFNFNSLSQIEIFKNRLDEEKNKIIEKQGYDIIDTTIYSMDKLEVNVGLKFLTPSGKKE